LVDQASSVPKIPLVEGITNRGQYTMGGQLKKLIEMSNVYFEGLIEQSKPNVTKTP